MIVAALGDTPDLDYGEIARRVYGRLDTQTRKNARSMVQYLVRKKRVRSKATAEGPVFRLADGG